MASGCAFIHEGEDVYVYLLHNGGPKGKKNQLFKRQADGTFKDVSAGSGLDVAGFSMGVAVGDVNNDGLPDVLLTQYGGVRLFVAFFVLAPMAQSLFRATGIPRRLMPPAIVLGTSTFTMWHFVQLLVAFGQAAPSRDAVICIPTEFT